MLKNKKFNFLPKPIKKGSKKQKYDPGMQSVH